MPKNILISSTEKRNDNLGCYYLPKALLDMNIRYTTDEMGNPSISFTADVRLVPDTSLRYYLNYNPSWFSSDEITVTFTPEGFLQSIHTKVTDDTAEVVSTVIKSIGSVLTGQGAGVGTRGLEDGGGAFEMPANPQIFKGLIDPLDAKKVELLNQLLAAHKMMFVVAPVSGDVAAVNRLEVPSEGAGVYYRPFESYQIAIASNHPQLRMSDEFIVSLPSATAIHCARIPLGRFVENVFDMTFTNGYPQSVTVNKPSSAKAIANIPFDIINAIIAMPSQLLQFRINWTRDMASQQSQLIDAKTMEQDSRLKKKVFEEQSKDFEKKLNDANFMINQLKEAAAADRAKAAAAAAAAAATVAESTATPMESGGGSMDAGLIGDSSDAGSAPSFLVPSNDTSAGMDTSGNTGTSTMTDGGGIPVLH